MAERPRKVPSPTGRPSRIRPGMIQFMSGDVAAGTRPVDEPEDTSGHADSSFTKNNGVSMGTRLAIEKLDQEK